MKKNLSLTLAAWILAPGLALAQSQTGAPSAPTSPPASPDVQQDRQEVRNDIKEMQSLDAKHVADVKALNAQEKTAMDAVKDDASLTPAQKKAKLAALRAQFKALRKALNQKFRADKKIIQTDMRKDRTDIRKDERGFRPGRGIPHWGMRHEIEERHEGGGRR